jgi:histidine phosphotransferase ChpT
MSRTPVPAHALAAGLASRLLHDLAGPIAGVATGVDLWTSPGDADLKAEGADLAAASAAALIDALEFCRVAFGGVGEDRDADQLAKLAQSPFAGKRARLVWAVPPMSLGGAAASALLIMAQIVAGALPGGGEARVNALIGAGGLALTLEGAGPRVKLGQEVLDGLEGRPCPSGPPGRWAPAAYLSAIVATVGGAISWRTLDEGFQVEAVLP